MPAFRQAAAARRCLVPANGFYEWQARGRERLPFLFTLRGGEPFAFAGLWEPAGTAGPEAFCILTTVPNDLMAPIHDRMPVLLGGGALGRWLGDAPLGGAEMAGLTRPLDSARMECRRVSRFVSNSRHEGPECLGPAEEEPPEFDFG
jgi:putative SOS response-associated peptidase YedK